MSLFLVKKIKKGRLPRRFEVDLRGAEAYPRGDNFSPRRLLRRSRRLGLGSLLGLSCTQPLASLFIFGFVGFLLEHLVVLDVVGRELYPSWLPSEHALERWRQ